VGVGAAGIIFLFLAGSVAVLAPGVYFCIFRWRMVEPVPVVFRFAPDVYFFGGYFLAGEVGE